MAYCITSRALRDVAWRRENERWVADMASGSWDAPSENQLQTALHEEIHRLPEEYRIPVVLCDLEGRTQAEAARCLRCSLRTVRMRLTRARHLLQASLGRRRPAIPATSCVAALSRDLAVPEALARATIEAAMRSRRATRGRSRSG